MALYHTSRTLIDSIVRRGQIPKSQNTFKDPDFLAIANEELMHTIVPEVLKYHEDYFLYTQSVPLVAGTSRYAIPHRAIGNKLYDLAYEDTQGNIYEMVRIPKAHIADYQGVNSSRNDTIHTYYIENNEIRLTSNTQEATGNLLFMYYFRPNELVLPERVATITDINTTTGVITVDAIPTNFSLSIQYDFLQKQNPHKTISFDQTASGLNDFPNTITFDVADIPTNLVVGDMIAQAEECMIPQIPTELHPMLAHKTLERVMEALGDQQGLQNVRVKLAEYESKSALLIDDRVEQSPQKVVPRSGLLSNARRKYLR